MRLIFYILTGLILSVKTYGQSDDLTKYQDTVFIKYNKDWSDDKINYVTDTVIFETGMRRHILTGTAILPSTSNQTGAKEYGLDFVKIKKSDCQKDVTEFGGELQSHINSILTTDSTLTIDINIYDNCCYDFLCDISVDTLGTLNLITYGYGTYCSCDCCFGLTYHLTVMKDKDIPEIKSVMINNNRKTLKPIKTR